LFKQRFVQAELHFVGCDDLLQVLRREAGAAGDLGEALADRIARREARDEEDKGGGHPTTANRKSSRLIRYPIFIWLDA
jgi:hypothetical protein